jgi:hypothetical protein
MVNCKRWSYLIAGAMSLPALAGYGKEDTQIMFSFGGGGNNARMYAEVLAQAERDRNGKPVAALADRLTGVSAGAMFATFLTVPHHSDGRPRSAQETLDHMVDHSPRILGALATGFIPFFSKPKIQAGTQKAMAAALGSNADLSIRKLPRQTELIMAEVIENQVLAASFTAASAGRAEVPDVTLAQALTAAVGVEQLAGKMPLAAAGQDSKSARVFMDAGSRFKFGEGQCDPTPGVIRTALASKKPAHIFAFEAGFGFHPETLAWAEQTQNVEDLEAAGISLEALAADGMSLGGLDLKYSRVRVHLFHASEPKHWDCASCGNPEGKTQAACTDHGTNVARLVGEYMPTARDRVLALNIQAALATQDMNAELKRVAGARMIGPEDGRSPSYRKLLAVLAEADAARAGSAAGAGAVETKAEVKSDAAAESKAAKS